MKPEILTKWLEAAKELWGENPELRNNYNYDLSAYLDLVRLRIEAQQEWYDKPSLHKEFFGDFNIFLSYKKAESQGLMK